MRNHEKKTNAALTFEENKSYHVQNICYIWKTSIYYKKYYKVRYQCRSTGKYRNKYTCSLRHNIPKKKSCSILYCFYICLSFHNQWACRKRTV